MAKLADLQAKAESLGIPTEKDGKKLTIAELEAAIESEETPQSPPAETPKEPEAEDKYSPNPSEGDVKEPTEAKEEEVKTGKTARVKNFRERVNDTVPLMVSFVNGRITEEALRKELKDLISE